MIAVMLELQQLDLRIGERTLIQQLDLQLQPGQIWCVLGRNGSGKSTLLRTLAGLQPPASGQIKLDGKTLGQWQPADLARRRAYLPQHQSDAFGLSVLQTVLLGRFAHGGSWDSDADLALAQAAMTQMDVETLAQRDIRSLSGGERQRVALAMVLAQATPLLLLDEPSNHLDLAHQLALVQQLRQWQQSGPHAALVVLHDLNLALRLASHVLLLMPDGSWQAGPVATVISAASLQACLNQAFEPLQHAGRQLWLALDN